ncbi:hypothetical protein RFI_17208, partial [Reticulomyxa filosa]
EQENKDVTNEMNVKNNRRKKPQSKSKAAKKAIQYNKVRSQLEKIGLFRTNFVEGDICSVCVDSDVEDVQVYCDGCNVCVHRQCYGIVRIPQVWGQLFFFFKKKKNHPFYSHILNMYTKSEWYCDVCASNGNKKPETDIVCDICKTNVDKAFKQTSPENTWVHISCALWLTGPVFENTTTLTPVKNISAIDSQRYALRCIFCQKQKGACLQCELCTVAYHVPCANRGTALLELRE